MMAKRFSEEQIIGVLREAQAEAKRSMNAFRSGLPGWMKRSSINYPAHHSVKAVDVSSRACREFCA